MSVKTDLLEISEIIVTVEPNKVLNWRLEELSRFPSLIEELVQFFLNFDNSEFSNTYDYEIKIGTGFLDYDNKGISPLNIINLNILNKSTRQLLVQIRIPYPDPNYDYLLYKEIPYVLPLDYADEVIFVGQGKLKIANGVSAQEGNIKFRGHKFPVYVMAGEILNRYFPEKEIFITKDKPSFVVTPEYYWEYFKFVLNKEVYYLHVRNDKLEDPKFVKAFALEKFFFTRKVTNSGAEIIKKPPFEIKTPSNEYHSFIWRRRLSGIIDPNLPHLEYFQHLVSLAFSIYYKEFDEALNSTKFRYIRYTEYILDELERTLLSVRRRLKPDLNQPLVYTNIIDSFNGQKTRRLNWAYIWNPFTELRLKTRAAIPYTLTEEMKNLHETQKYKICPLDTSDKDKVGKIVSLSPTVELDELGRFEDNYFKLFNF